MTTTPEPLENKVNGLESALGRLAELSFNNAARHDRAIDQLLEVTSRNSEAVTRHDQAIARMEDAITNLTNTVADNNTRMEQAITNLTNTVASSNLRIEQNNTRIEQILEYLRNRNGGSSPL